MSPKGIREEEEINRKKGSSTTGSQRAVYHSDKFRSLAVRNCNIVTTSLRHEDSHRSFCLAVGQVEMGSKGVVMGNYTTFGYEMGWEDEFLFWTGREGSALL